MVVIIQQVSNYRIVDHIWKIKCFGGSPDIQSPECCSIFFQYVWNRCPESCAPDRQSPVVSLACMYDCNESFGISSKVFKHIVKLESRYRSLPKLFQQVLHLHASYDLDHNLLKVYCMHSSTVWQMGERISANSASE